MHDDLFVIIEEMVLGTPKPVLAGFFVILASLILTWIKQGADERERHRRYHAPRGCWLRPSLFLSLSPSLSPSLSFSLTHTHSLPPSLPASPSPCLPLSLSHTHTHTHSQSSGVPSHAFQRCLILFGLPIC